MSYYDLLKIAEESGWDKARANEGKVVLHDTKTHDRAMKKERASRLGKLQRTIAKSTAASPGAAGAAHKTLKFLERGPFTPDNLRYAGDELKRGWNRGESWLRRNLSSDKAPAKPATKPSVSPAARMAKAIRGSKPTPKAGDVEPAAKEILKKTPPKAPGAAETLKKDMPAGARAEAEGTRRLEEQAAKPKVLSRQQLARTTQFRGGAGFDTPAKAAKRAWKRKKQQSDRFRKGTTRTEVDAQGNIVPYKPWVGGGGAGVRPAGPGTPTPKAGDVEPAAKEILKKTPPAWLRRYADQSSSNEYVKVMP